MKELTRERVAPIISASVSWEIAGSVRAGLSWPNNPSHQFSRRADVCDCEQPAGHHTEYPRPTVNAEHADARGPCRVLPECVIRSAPLNSARATCFELDPESVSGSVGRFGSDFLVSVRMETLRRMT